MALAVIAQRTFQPVLPNDSDKALEKHYSVGEVAKMWGWSQNTIRRMFANEPGILEWGTEETRFKRSYTTLRIPESVIARVHRRLTKQKGR